MSTKQATNRKNEDTGFNKSLLYWIGGGALGLALIVWLAFAIATDESLSEDIGFGEVTVTGDALPFLADPSTTDPALGLVAPTVAGADWDDNPVTIEADGRAKIVVFLAHWCPHCQAEVPVIQEWVDGGGLPDGVDLYGVTIFTDRLRSNWPPQEWLVDEGWTAPTVMDDEDSSSVFAYGVRGTPFYIVLDGDNRNLGRFSGEVGVGGLRTMAQLASASIGG